MSHAANVWSERDDVVGEFVITLAWEADVTAGASDASAPANITVA
jgi:hypothetical protein